MSTIKDVASLAGVSATTVSIVVNGQSVKRNISKETQEKVLSAIKELNYTPNLSARKLRSNKGKEINIGIFWSSDTRASLLSRILHGIQSAKSLCNEDINIVICPFKSDEIHKETKLYSPFSLDGAIIATASSIDMQFIQNNKPLIPIVLFNRENDEFNSVGVDNRAIGNLAFDILKSNDVKSITLAKVNDDNSFLSMIARRNALKERCLQNNVNLIESKKFSAENTLEGGVDIGLSLLQSPLPDAIFCDCDSIARGILKTFLLNNISVGKDVLVLSIGLSETELTKHTIPSLSVIDIPYEEISKKSVDLLTEIILSGTQKITNIVLPVNIHIRQSCL